ncbi:MAG: DNA gyrase subunit A [Geopsychrobacter sp.]|nr:DNA gyrase subunit A [Geopsychrobacter sp.]
MEDEVRSSFLAYSMSVIIQRALPDVRDGLKPVHRRILYAMNQEGLLSNRPYAKSAGVVGEVLKHYHPHGDSAVYDSMVRMAQDFSLRYPLVDGQGNFGSIDGDSPAAYRYTEARLAKLAEEMLRDIDRETVEFQPNFDGQMEEPVVLPTRFPNLLANGSTGIAVGMATNVPPHNLRELTAALILVAEDPDCSLDDILEKMPGPDFPTGATLCGTDGIRSYFATGRGHLSLRAKAEFEPYKRGTRIVVTEIPYQVNKSLLLERIADLVRDGRLEGIADLRDESSREGMRVVIELKKDAAEDIILNQLYKMTAMQSSFGIIMLAIVSGQPRVLTLRETLDHFIDHRREIVTRRCIFELKKAEARAHILEGLRIALDNLDEVISLIKSSANPAEAKLKLIERFAFSEIQSQAILDMRLHRLTGLERDKIINELNEVMAQIARLKEILASEVEILKIIHGELIALKDQFANPRRTEIIDRTADLTLEDMIVEEDMVVTVSNSGYIKRNPVSLYRAQRRGGKGKTGMRPKEEDFVEHLFIASTHSYILVFTTMGRAYWLKVHEIPQGGRAARGKAIINLLQLDDNETVTTILPVKEFVEGRYIVMATRNGIIKKSELMAYSRPRVGGIIALNVDEGDALISTRLTDGDMDILLATRAGKSIRFPEKDVRAIGRIGRGVRGMNLEKDDHVIGMQVVSDNTAATLVTVTENGYGKRTELDEYRVQSRGGKGVITIKTTERNGQVVDIKKVDDESDLMFITDGGKVLRTRVSNLSTIGRNTQGVRLMVLEPGEHIVSVAKLAEKETEHEPTDAEEETNQGPEGEEE